MRDRSKQLLVINTGKKQPEQAGMPSQSGTTHIIGGGGLSVNKSDYLLKSIWDKVFEIRTDSQGTEYIFGKLPVVTQYGITMYSGDGVDIPSLASGLPFDGRTIWYNPDTQQIEVIGGTGGGSGEGVSNFWDLNNIPSWITNSKPKYTYSEIEGTPDLTKYALVSQIPSLSGYATESWVTKQNYATKAATLSGYGITDAYTKTNVDDLLKAYVTLGGTQTITGEKNFAGGLKVNGSPIYYDKEKKYWKLEGDLLITGGVTMYGNEGTYTPSTIMDAIAVDGITISKSGGVLKVIGGTGGGVADSVAWANITGKPNFASVATSGKYDDLIGKPTLLSSFTDDIVSGKYLPLSGGILKGVDNVLVINRTNLNQPCISYEYNGNSYGSIGLKGYGDAFVYNGNTKVINKIWHEGNLNPSDYLLLTGGTIKGQLTISRFPSTISFLNAQGVALGHIGYGGVNNPVVYMSDGSTNYNLLHSGNIDSYNAGSATKLATARTIWGQSFDGTSNISGLMTGLNYILGFSAIRNSSNPNESNGIWVGSSMSSSLINTDLAYYATKHIFLLGNVGIGTTSPEYTLHVNGSGYFSSNISIGTASIASLSMNRTSANYITTPTSGYMVFCMGGNTLSVATSSLVLYAHNVAMAMSGGNVGVGTVNPQYKLDIVGNTMVRDGWYRSRGVYGWYNEEYAGGWHMTDAMWIRNYNSKPLLLDIGTNNTNGIGGHRVGLTLRGASHCSIMMIGTNGGVGYGWGIAANADGNFYVGRRTGESVGYSSSTDSYKFRLDGSGNGLFYGGVTMYSDKRKKTILNHVELSLKQIAEAPLIEHYYNSDDKKTTHVGSIAQYWASMNDWFCKEDSEGFLTMEIQNAALASAISIARELDKYETKTDKAIKKLKKRICELEEEVERLKSA